MHSAAYKPRWELSAMECSNLTSAHTINMRDIFNAPASTCMQSIMAAHIDELAMGMPEPALSPQPKTGKYWMWRERKREEGRDSEGELTIKC